MSKTMDALIVRRMKRKGRATPSPLTEEEMTSAGRGRSGSWPASMTGARSLAERRGAFQSQRRILNAAGEGTRAFEDVIAGRKKKGGY